jgi:hypothetical protein
LDDAQRQIVFASSPNANLGGDGDAMPELPEKPDLDQLRRQARELLRGATNGEPSALRRLRAVSEQMTLSVAQLAVAREYGYSGWSQLRAEVERRRSSVPEARPSNQFGGRLGPLDAPDERWSLGGANAIEITVGVLSPSALVVERDQATLT